MKMTLVKKGDWKVMLGCVGAAVLTLAAQAGALAQEFTPQNLIKQIYYPDDLETGVPNVLFATKSEDSGTAVTMAPIGVNGATFELWADREDGGPKKVDTKSVGGLRPKSEFTVTLVDPWRSVVDLEVNGENVKRPIYRTRADWDYTVTVKANLYSDPALPQSLREIMVNQRGAKADAPTQDADPNYHTTRTNAQPLTATPTLANGQTAVKVGPLLTPLPGETAIIGEEYITADSFADEHVDSWAVGEATIKVWPVTTGRFTQLDGNGQEIAFQTDPIQTFNDQVPSIFVHYNHVYPGATCYVEVYKETDLIEAIPIEISSLSNIEVDEGDSGQGNDPADTPADGYRLRNEELNPYFARWGSGKYTLRIVQVDLPTVAGFEQVGDTVSFMVNRNVKVRGQIGTSSK